MGLDELVARREELLRVARAHGAVSVRVFGSTARGTAGPYHRASTPSPPPAQLFVHVGRSRLEPLVVRS